MSGPFKMKGFSGFGNSPAKDKSTNHLTNKEGEVYHADGTVHKKCPAGYYRDTSGECVLTKEGKDYKDYIEHEKRKKEKVVKLPLIEEKLSSTEKETKKKAKGITKEKTKPMTKEEIEKMPKGA